MHALPKAFAAFVLLMMVLSCAEKRDYTLYEPTRLESPAAPGSGEPYLAVAPDGGVFMSWFEKLDEGHALRIARLEGDAWGEIHTIASGDSFFVNWADYPKVLPLGAGRLAAHYPWMNGSGTYAYDVVMRFSDDAGATWGDPIRPHTDGTPTEHGFVSMVPAGEGVRAVWLDGRKGGDHPAGHGDDHGAGAEMTVRSAIVYADGRLADEAELDGRACDCCGTAAVVTRNGVLAAYRDRSETEVRDVSLAAWSEQTWSDPYTLYEDGWEIAGCPVNGPTLAAFDNTVLAVWYTAAQDTPAVRATFSPDGGRRFTPAMRIDDGDPIGRVGAAMIDDETAVVTWMENQEEGAAIRVRLLVPRGANETITLAKTSSSRGSGFPQVVHAGERLIFAWTEPGDVSQIHVATMPAP